LLSTKIIEEDALEAKYLRREYQHKITKLLKEVRKRIHVKLGRSWDTYFSMLEKAYSCRYPEGWKEATFVNDLSNLDTAYRYLRNNIVKNFPVEEQNKAEVFGGFIYKGYNPEVQEIIIKQGGLPPEKIFSIQNKEKENFNVKF